ncbi:hypothetical protein ASF10_08895 [Flavobacterium sp. Leaf82]|uniref:RHS repeat domain-containing protein n=1 Tax=Flavobacterium sp. Leaf82 TaxID=1736238 RepID=UPI0006FC20F3|nr:RHS repeat-associated core domain-containing protein [Flavobacterium sp. Leaf82]KQO22483.1 hypothetical protein ASF10_08895 [Flavobacterium sp. Leaf82]
MVYDKPEPIKNLITWVYEGGSFVPSAKIIGEHKFSIINDYIGRPIQVYNEVGDVVWETDYDIYGGLRNLKGDKSFIPFRQLGQYEDVETGLYYNRHRYYNPESGGYISQDPIGLLGGSASYKYVHDCNNCVDIFGLNPVIFSEELSKIAQEAHNVLLEPGKSPRGFNNSTVSVAKVDVNGVSTLYASGNGASLSPAQRTKLVELGVPEENIFSGKRFKEIIDGDTGTLTKLSNHAERVIERNIPKDASIKEWGISWASKQKNEMCNNCKTHFGCK